MTLEASFTIAVCLLYSGQYYKTFLGVIYASSSAFAIILSEIMPLAT